MRDARVGGGRQKKMDRCTGTTRRLLVSPPHSAPAGLYLPMMAGQSRSPRHPPDAARPQHWPRHDGEIGCAGSAAHKAQHPLHRPMGPQSQVRAEVVWPPPPRGAQRRATRPASPSPPPAPAPTASEVRKRATSTYVMTKYSAAGTTMQTAVTRVPFQSGPTISRPLHKNLLRP